MSNNHEYNFAYYQTLRNHARAMTVNSLNKTMISPEDGEVWKGITLASMTNEAIEFARIEWPKGDMDNYQAIPKSWESLFYSYMQIPANFNIAVWQENEGEKVLLGLALGRPSNAKIHLSINWIERSTLEPAFKGGILVPVLTCAEQYAKLLGCERVLIKNPLDPGQFEKYEYAPSPKSPKGASYLCKEIQHG